MKKMIPILLWLFILGACGDKKEKTAEVDVDRILQENCECYRNVKDDRDAFRACAEKNATIREKLEKDEKALQKYEQGLAKCIGEISQ